MSESIYVLVDKNGKTPTKSSGWKDKRKLLVYTSIGRAKAAIKARSLNEEDYDIIEYTPKEDQ
ncbi:hypothetical protein [Shouchella rhizosphaerae]|uniref:Uncharacterized protein n=1 Tax=Shouchella rhizosphaerae TaxID=866786 RepID=A0ABZ2CY41_9BACI|nr:hypothetical protein [Psychrobacillus sp. MER TA 17]